MAKDFIWPTSQKDQKDLKDKIERAARLLGEIDVIKSDIGSLAEDSKDAFGISSSEFNKYVKAFYDRNKFLETKQKIDEIASNLEIQ